MPFAGFDDFGDCLDTMMTEEGHDEEAARNICGALQAEEKSDHGNVDELRDALERGAGLIADVGVELVSGVDVPAIDSKWVAMKSDTDDADHNYRITAPLLKADDSEQRLTYAPAMIPRQLDKEGDVAPTHIVEKAAHGFLKSDGGIDTDHSLIDGEGVPVESWVLKDERTFDLPDGGEETYPEGTWMLGVEWAADAWERIKNGELTGLSIYGMAEHIPLSRQAMNLGKQLIDAAAETGRTPCELLSVAKSQTSDTHKGSGGESGDMAPDQTADTDDTDDAGDGPSIEEVAASVDDLADQVSTVTESMQTVKESLESETETEKQDAQEAAAAIAEEVDEMRPGDIMDLVQAAAGKELSDVMDAIDSISRAEDEDDDEEDDDGEMEASTDADEANLDKGADARATASKGIDSAAAGNAGLSYAALADQGGDD